MLNKPYLAAKSYIVFWLPKVPILMLSLSMMILIYKWLSLRKLILMLSSRYLIHTNHSLKASTTLWKPQELWALYFSKKGIPYSHDTWCKNIPHHAKIFYPASPTRNHHKRRNTNKLNLAFLNNVMILNGSCLHLWCLSLNGSCRPISNFCELNKVTKKLNYLLPVIQDIFHFCRSFCFITLLDVSMQLHTFILDAVYAIIYIIATPYGMCKTLWFPIDFLNWLKTSWKNFSSHLTTFEVHINDIGIKSKA